MNPQTLRASRSLRDLWTLDPSVTFLNHGSFGACPRVVLDAQRRLRDQMEREPVRFFVREAPALLDAARRELGAFLGADPDDLAFMPNATAGVNTVLRSLAFQPGDELLVTDHEYNACRNALAFTAERTGARVVVAPVPFPIASSDAVVEGLLAHVTKRTRLALVDHVTSQTGLVFPIRKIASELLVRGVDLLVDGAHAPGMVPLDIERIGAAYYTGNCHKWLCAPKGAAFLWVRRDEQARIRPLSISHGANASLDGRSRYRVEFDWTGTDDFTPHLCIPEAIRFMGSLLPGGFDELMERNKALALAGRATLCAALGVAEPSPASMVGSLAAVPLPGPGGSPRAPLYTDPLQDELLGRHGIEVPIVPWPAPPRRLVRVSAQIYNELADYERLASALRERLA